MKTQRACTAGLSRGVPAAVPKTKSPIYKSGVLC